MTERETKEAHEDEIDLYELLLVLKKRIKLIIAVFGLGVVAATVVSFLIPNIYHARASIWVYSSLTTTMLKNLLQLNQFGGENKFSFMIPSESRPPDINNMSLSILNNLEFRKKVLNEVKNIYGNTKDILDLEKDLNAGEWHKIFSSSIDKTTGAIILSSDQKEKNLAEEILKISIKEFEKELEKASQTYAEVLGQTFEKLNKNDKLFVLHVVEQPTSLEKPVKPKRKLIIAVSGVTFLILGVFSAFVVEWWSRVRSTQ